MILPLDAAVFPSSIPAVLVAVAVSIVDAVILVASCKFAHVAAISMVAVSWALYAVKDTAIFAPAAPVPVVTGTT